MSSLEKDKEKKPQMTTCRACGRSWPMNSVQAHCPSYVGGGCCRHFAKSGIFDDHFAADGTHRDPVDKAKVYVQDETGMWKGVMPEEDRLRLGFNSALAPEG